MRYRSVIRREHDLAPITRRAIRDTLCRTLRIHNKLTEQLRSFIFKFAPTPADDREKLADELTTVGLHAETEYLNEAIRRPYMLALVVILYFLAIYLVSVIVYIQMVAIAAAAGIQGWGFLWHAWVRG
jgi:hypothetical protein